MRRSRKDQVIRTQLVDVLKSLHGCHIDEGPAVIGQLYRAIDDVVHCLCLVAWLAFTDTVIIHLEVAALTSLVLQIDVVFVVCFVAVH